MEVFSIEKLVERVIEISENMKEMDMDGDYDCTIFVNDNEFDVRISQFDFSLDDLYEFEFSDYDNIEEMTKAVAEAIGEDSLAEDGIYIWEKDYCEA